MATAWTGRHFAVSSDGTTRQVDIACSFELDAAMDILGDAGMLDDTRVQLLVTAEQSGRNPEHFARHLVKLAQALRQ